MKCPHCNKVLYHQIIEEPVTFRSKTICQEQYLFRCECIKYKDLSATNFGFEHLVTPEGNKILTGVITGNYGIVSAVYDFYDGERRQPGTHIYSYAEYQVVNSNIKYKRRHHMVHLSENKDLTTEINIPKLESWAKTLTIFS